MSLSLLLSTFFALPLAAVLPASGSSNIPLLLWHGLGDAYDSEGIKAVGTLYQKLWPDSLVYLVHLGDNGGADRHSSFFGNLTEQVNDVCNDIRDNEELSRAPAANALGFSQGGVFIRGLLERCDAINIRSLVTFGSPHSGITEFADCADDDWWCRIWSGTLKGNTWSPFAQSTLVPAQYYRNSEDLESYLLYSNFLADINNDREGKSGDYKKRIAALEHFVMYKFQDEDVLQPPESSWFADLNSTSGLLTKLKERDMYKDEWLGLKRLDEAGGLIFRTTPGKHMQIQDDALEDAFKRYYAPTAAAAEEDVSEGAQDWASTVKAQSGQSVLGASRGQSKQSWLEADEDDEPSNSALLRHYAAELADTLG